MKHFFTSFCMLAVVSWMSAATSLTLTLTAPGELADALGDDAFEVKSLTIEGPIDATYFATMWR